MEPAQILETTRGLIREYAGDDPDLLFYANRFVYSRLQLDERKTKPKIKRRLYEKNPTCRFCGGNLDQLSGIHLNRIDSSKTYSFENCDLMHADCHRKHHRESKKSKEKSIRSEGPVERCAVKRKESQLYSGQNFLYWWDISPFLREKLEEFEDVEFVKSDNGEICLVSTKILAAQLTPERQTSRKAKSWGVKVLKKRPDEIALEPATGSKEWIFLPVTWITPEE